MAKIKGTTVTLFERIKTGEDAFKHPIYKEEGTQISNILIAPASTNEIAETMNLTGKKAVYTIAIPKSDTHRWEDNRIEFFGESWRVIGFPQEGIEKNIPLEWNKKYMVERYG